MAPGTYTVQAVGLVNKWVVYAVITEPTLEVKPDGTSKLSLGLQAGANLKVRDFPGFLSFGGITDLVDPTGQDFINARAASLFKYAGNDGRGYVLAVNWLVRTVASEVPVSEVTRRLGGRSTSGAVAAQHGST